MLQIAPESAAQKVLNDLRKGRQCLSIPDDSVGDLFREHLQEGFDRLLRRRAGIVYLAAVPSTPNLYKIGFTRKTLDQRMTTLRSAGVLVRLVPIEDWAVYDAPYVEALCHRHLKPLQVEREFFQGDWRSLVQTMTPLITHEQQQLEQVLVGLGMDPARYL